MLIAAHGGFFHIDWAITLAGLIVGFAVGLTGMGGGALMTPVLVLLLGVTPSAAVSSDLVASFFMKPVGGGVHLKRGTVHLKLAAWLVAAAAPAAFAGAAVLNSLAKGKTLQNDVKYGLGAALLVATVGIAAKTYTSARHARRGTAPAPATSDSWPKVRVIPTLIIGLVGGFIVGMTSVGSGSLMIVSLMFLYPTMTGSQLVGTDLVGSIPLVGAGALGQLIFGHVQFSLTASLLIGAIPAVFVGAQLSSRAPTTFMRPAIAIVLLLSALKLVNVSNDTLGIVGGIAIAAGLVALVVWRLRNPAGRLQAAPSELTKVAA